MFQGKGSVIMDKARCTFVLCTLWLYLISLHVSYSLPRKHFYRLAYGQKIWLERAIEGLEKAIYFYKVSYKEVNIDSIYGLRVAEGFLAKSLLKLGDKNVDKMTKTLIRRIRALHSAGKDVAEKSLSSLKNRNKRYFETFSHIVAKPWSYVREYKNFSQASLVKVVTQEDDEQNEDGFNEELSDNCMSNLMGTQREGEKKKCQIPEKCWEMMTKTGSGGYLITHQGLFFILAEVTGCHNEIIEKTLGEQGLVDIFTHIGSNIYYQAKELSRLGIPSDYKDLFMEQVVLCGMLGIIQCYDVEWLKIILSWQDDTGCFKEPRFRELQEEKLKEREEGHIVQVVTEIVEYGEETDNGTVRHTVEGPGRRKLLEEVELSGGCLAHMTGVATGLFGIYVHWLLHPPDYKRFSLVPPWGMVNQVFTSSPSTFSGTHTLLFLVFGIAATLLIVRRMRRRKRVSKRSFFGL